MRLLNVQRVEKYRPNSLDDVEGHKDIIATINKFVDSNVRPSTENGKLRY
jgi:hypothetical protein